jgi:hypothetical protein
MCQIGGQCFDFKDSFAKKGTSLDDSYSKCTIYEENEITLVFEKKNRIENWRSGLYGRN